MAVEAIILTSLLLLKPSASSEEVIQAQKDGLDVSLPTDPPLRIFRWRSNKMGDDCTEGDLNCQTRLNSSLQSSENIREILDHLSTMSKVKINEELRDGSQKDLVWSSMNSIGGPLTHMPYTSNSPQMSSMPYMPHISSMPYMPQMASMSQRPQMSQIPHIPHPSQVPQMSYSPSSSSYDDHKAWVTLEPIPWSTSKVSKWKPNVVSVRPPESHYGQTPSSSNLWISNGIQPQAQRPSSHWSSNDIITDNKPSGFPSYDENRPISSSSGYRPGYPSHSPPTPTVITNFQSQSNYPVPPAKPSFMYNNYEPTNNLYGDSRPPNFQHHGHPLSYPSEGNGQWVLLSTTRGYSVPKRYEDRKIKVNDHLEDIKNTPAEIISRNSRSKYEEKDLLSNFMVSEQTPSEDVNRKSGEFHPEGEPIWSVDGINILKTSTSNGGGRTGKFIRNHEVNEVDAKPEKDFSTEKVFKRTVRLTVLPALDNSSTTSHDGLLEISSGTKSVEEEQRETERRNKLHQLNVLNMSPYQMFPVVQGGRMHDHNKKKAAVLAAVGAGMIPAAMAVLLPAALGRKRRSTDFRSDLNIFHNHQ